MVACVGVGAMLWCCLVMLVLACVGVGVVRWMRLTPARCSGGVKELKPLVSSRQSVCATWPV